MPKTFPQPAQRQARLQKIRRGKLMRSSQAFVRGSAERFYEWLASASDHKIPQGPPIWICGDAHVGNFGPIANAKGGIDIQIRDFDQTVIGNPAHDIIRLGLSLASATRVSDLSGIIIVKVLDEVAAGYKETLANFKLKGSLKGKWPKSVKRAYQSAVMGTWQTLAKEYVENARPTIPLSERFWPLSKNERKEIAELFQQDKVRRLVTSLRRRDDDSSVTVYDAAFWAKGCSSLGGLRYGVLLGVGKKHPEYCLIDIKEAVLPAALKHPRAKMPNDQAERVALGAWHMSPALGNRILATALQKRPVFLRELLPQDLKFEIEQVDEKEALRVAKFLGSVLGKAHARQMDDKTRQAWLVEFHGRDKKNPCSWLRSGVMELLVNHEQGYLQYCFAAPNARIHLEARNK